MPEVGVDRAGQELGAAEVDAYDASLDHAGHVTAPMADDEDTRNTPSTAPARGSLGARRTSWAAASRASRARAAPLGRSAAATREPAAAGAGSPSAAWSATWRWRSARGCSSRWSLFLVSAQIQSAKVSDAADAKLSGGGYPLTSPNTILVLGSDARTKEQRRAGRADDRRRRAGRTRSCCCASAAAPTRSSRSCATPWSTSPATAATRSTPRTRSAARRWRSRPSSSTSASTINHLVEVNFENFPDLIDSLGGITYTGNRVISRINGGSRNGGYTLRLKAGTNELNGERGARARAHAQERQPPAGGRPVARDPPAEDPQRDQGQGHLVRDVHPAAVGRRGRRRRRSARTCPARRCSG